MATEKKIQLNPRALRENMLAFAQGFRPPTYTAAEVLNELKEPIQAILEKRGSADDIFKYLQSQDIPITLPQLEKFIADLSQAGSKQDAGGKRAGTGKKTAAAPAAAAPAPKPNGPPAAPVPPALPPVPPVGPIPPK